MNNIIKQLYLDTLENINSLSQRAVELRADSKSGDDAEDVGDVVSSGLGLEDKMAVVNLNLTLDDTYTSIYNYLAKELEEEEKNSKK